MDLPRDRFPDSAARLPQIPSLGRAIQNAQASVPKARQKVKSIGELWQYKQQQHSKVPIAQQSQHRPYHHLSAISQLLLIPAIVTGWDLVRHVDVRRGTVTPQLR